MDYRQTSKKRSSGARGNVRIFVALMMTLIFGLLLVVCLVLYSRLQHKRSQAADGQGAHVALDLNLESEEDTDVTGWFREREIEVVKDARELLARVNQGRSVGDFEGLVMNQRQAQRLVSAKAAEAWADYDVATMGEYSWEIQSREDVPFLVMNGFKKNHKKYRAYFRRSGDEVVLDWDATSGYSPHSIEELPGQSGAGEKLLRCWVAKDPSYDGRTDEKVDSWYLLLDAHKEHYVWGVSPKDSKVDEDLKDAMRYGYFALSKEREIRALVKVKRGEGLGEKEFRIVKLVSDEWILPNDKDD